MTIFLNPYKKASGGARSLRTALVQRGFRTLIGHKAPNRHDPLIVFWGNSDPTFDPRPYRNVVNNPALLGAMTNKLRFFNKVGHSDTVPAWTVAQGEAEKWPKVMARQKLEGSGGEGIVVWEPGAGPLPRAPLYVKYENKTHEFRVHVARSLHGSDFEPILVQRKIFQKSADMPQPLDWNIRNHANGFVFVRESGFPTPASVLKTAKDFMTKHFSGLHFAALDIIYHEKKKQSWVLEGNTAPGLEGNTVEVYSEYIAGLAKEARA